MDEQVADAGEAQTLAVAEYVVRGGNPDDVTPGIVPGRCLVCEQSDVPLRHRTPLGHECPAARYVQLLYDVDDV